LYPALRGERYVANHNVDFRFIFRAAVGFQSHSPSAIPATNLETVGFQDHSLRQLGVYS